MNIFIKGTVQGVGFRPTVIATVIEESRKEELEEVTKIKIKIGPK